MDGVDVVRLNGFWCLRRSLRGWGRTRWPVATSFVGLGQWVLVDEVTDPRRGRELGGQIHRLELGRDAAREILADVGSGRSSGFSSCVILIREGTLQGVVIRGCPGAIGGQRPRGGRDGLKREKREKGGRRQRQRDRAFGGHTHH